VLELSTTSTGNLLAAERTAGVGHHVALSVVGTERLSESGYFRAKLAQERLIKESGVPYSSVHATQCLEFLQRIADSATEATTVRLSHALIQPSRLRRSPARSHAPLSASLSTEPSRSPDQSSSVSTS
jgi:uncharacterized protein YbjT (DUF2867 family)